MPSTHFHRDANGVANPRARHPRCAALRTLTPIVRRLHLQELPRIRREATRLALENEQLRDRAERAEDCARWWHDDVMRMMEDGLQVGLTKSGHVVALGTEASR